MTTAIDTFANQNRASKTTSQALRVLILDDEQEIREILAEQLRQQGMIVESIASGENFLSEVERYQPQLIVMDQLLPGKYGTRLVAELRSSKYSDVPVMMLTGIDSEADKVNALELGADDYVVKPFSIREVTARVHALLRRSLDFYKSEKKKMQLKNLEVDFDAHRVLKDGQEVLLTLTEFKILVELMKQVGQVLTRDRLRERALGNLNVTDRTIDVHMASLRKKLSELGDKIETVRGVGYRFVL